MNLAFRPPAVTKLPLASSVLIVLLMIASRGIGKTNDPVSVPVPQVTGQVRLLQTISGGAMKDNSEVVAWLIPLEAVHKVRLKAEPTHYRMIQHNKLFEPHLLVVPVGSIVEFPNYDPYFHNVFSVSSAKRFDLGLFQAGARKAVRFDRPGPSMVFCNIHPEMMAVVFTVDSPYFAVSDKTGHLTISNVPPGRYLLRVWYENATPRALEALQRTIVVENEDHNLPTILIAMTNQNFKGRKD